MKGDPNGRRLLHEPMNFEYRKTRLDESLTDRDSDSGHHRGSPLILTGILQKADVLNQNGRIYPRNILAREVDNYNRAVRERRSTGELDHPESSVVEFKNVSHLVTKLWWEGNVVMGSIEILPTPNGKIVESLVERKVKIGVSSRGVGSTKEKGDYLVVCDDFQLICWDIVTEPSTPMAFVEPESGGNRASDDSGSLYGESTLRAQRPTDDRWSNLRGILRGIRDGE